MEVKCNNNNNINDVGVKVVSVINLEKKGNRYQVSGRSFCNWSIIQSLLKRVKS